MSARKPPAKRQRGKRTLSLHVAPGAAAVAKTPKPPPGMLKSTRDQWARYWGSSLAQIIELTTDLPALERLFSLYDERRRCHNGYQKERLMQGSTGQRVLNPLGRLIGEFDKEIRAMEDRFGLTPKARLALGITFSDAARS